MARRPRRKPIPVALAVNREFAIVDGRVRSFERPLVDQLGPLDDLNLRLVADDERVREAMTETRIAFRRYREALKQAAESPEASRTHIQLLRAWEIQKDQYLKPTVERALRRRAALLKADPPEVSEIDARLGAMPTADRFLAVHALLRRNPHWRDPLLWSAPDTRRYLAKAVASEARFLSKRQRSADRMSRLGARLTRRLPEDAVSRLPSRKPSPEQMLEAKQEKDVARQERRLALRVLRKLRRQQIPISQKRILEEATAAGCGLYTAASRLGLPRSAALALRNRASRLLDKEMQNRSA